MARYRIHLCGADPDPPLVDDNPDCPNSANHVRSPRGYVEWHEWAEKQAETHEPAKCPGCDRWLLLSPLTKQGDDQ